MNGIFFFFTMLWESLTIPLTYPFLILWAICVYLTISSAKKTAGIKWAPLFLMDLTGIAGALILFITEPQWSFCDPFDVPIAAFCALVLFGILLVADWILLARKWNPSKS